jgi:hypothetical protein
MSEDFYLVRGTMPNISIVRAGLDGFYETQDEPQVSSSFGVVEFLQYKGKYAIFIVNYDPVRWDALEYFKFLTINISAIKSIYINENIGVIAQYINDPYALQIAMRLGGVVFIETYPEDQIPAEGGKGVRKTWLEGYSAVKEFYSPNYSEIPPEPDYRRTLYWNPMVATDENGKAKVNFYNNSTCTKFSISAETVTQNGMIGVYKKIF